jgi:reverse gyrase
VEGVNTYNLPPEERTRELERKMRLVEEGQAYYQDVIRETFEEIKPVLKELGFEV